MVALFGFEPVAHSIYLLILALALLGFEHVTSNTLMSVSDEILRYSGQVLFSCGAMVARLTSNQKVAGSSPASGGLYLGVA